MAESDLSSVDQRRIDNQVRLALELARAKLAIERVRALHVPRPVWFWACGEGPFWSEAEALEYRQDLADDGELPIVETWCAVCRGRYPCSTLAALDGHPQDQQEGDT